MERRGGPAVRPFRLSKNAGNSFDEKEGCVRETQEGSLLLLGVFYKRSHIFLGKTEKCKKRGGKFLKNKTEGSPFGT